MINFNRYTPYTQYTPHTELSITIRIKQLHIKGIIKSYIVKHAAIPDYVIVFDTIDQYNGCVCLRMMVFNQFDDSFYYTDDITINWSKLLTESAQEIFYDRLLMKLTSSKLQELHCMQRNQT